MHSWEGIVLETETAPHKQGWNFILVIRRWKAMCYLWAVILLLWSSSSALPAVQGWEYASSWPTAQIVNYLLIFCCQSLHKASASTTYISLYDTMQKSSIVREESLISHTCRPCFCVECYSSFLRCFWISAMLLCIRYTLSFQCKGCRFWQIHLQGVIFKMIYSVQACNPSISKYLP